MEDVSEIFKRGFQNLNKPSKTIQDRKDLHVNLRRETRINTLFQKRNIDENMTPINTPEPQRTAKERIPEEKKVVNKVAKPNKRLEMLAKWKAEKEKRKQEEKKKAKPIFKVCHVPSTIGNSLENVNKAIKGKPIRPKTPHKSKFAPRNHQFKAPDNIKPIDWRTKQISLSEKKKRTTASTDKLPAAQSKVVPRVGQKSGAVRKQTDSNVKCSPPKKTKRDVPARSTRRNLAMEMAGISEEEKITKDKQVGKKETVGTARNLRSTKQRQPEKEPTKKTPKKSRKDHVQEVEEPQNSSTSFDKESSKPQKTEKNTKKLIRQAATDLIKDKDNEIADCNDGSVPKNPLKPHRKTWNKPKNVCWDAVEVVDSDDEILNGEIAASTPKNRKTYIKTPKRSKHVLEKEAIGKERTDDKESTEDLHKDKEINIKTPKKDRSEKPEKKLGNGKLPTSKCEDIPKSKKASNKTPKKTKQCPGTENLGTNAVEDKQSSRISESTLDNKKHVVVEVVDSDDEVFSREIAADAPKNKKIYAKTPKRSKHVSKKQDVERELTDDKKESTEDLGKDKTITNKPPKKVRQDPDAVTPNISNEISDEVSKSLKINDKLSTRKSEDIPKSKKTSNKTSQKTKQQSPGTENTESTPDNKKQTRKSQLTLPTDTLQVNLTNITEASEQSSRTSQDTEGSASTDYPIDNSLNSSIHTPAKPTTGDADFVYISPFVTLSRGKSNARREHKLRGSMGGTLPETPDFSKNTSTYTSPKAGAEYFRRLLDSEIERIEKMCDEWQEHRDDKNLPEEAYDTIDVTIGQSRLLIAKKFQQFRGLIVECKTQEYKGKPITCEDLHGFWDMMYMQVEDLDKRFKNLQTLKDNGWHELLVTEKVKPVEAKRARGRPKKVKANSFLKSYIKAQRKMKKNEQNGDVLQLPEEKLFDGGYFSVKSPIKDPVEKLSNARKSLRVSLLASQAINKRCSSSPCLTMMKVSQAMKYGDGVTPSKSILKTDTTKSTGKKTVLFKEHVDSENVRTAKTVLFPDADAIDDKENVVGNLIEFSPLTPRRRSRRISNARF